MQSLRKLYCKFINAYLYAGVPIVYVSIFKVGCSRHFSFALATQHFALFLYRFTMENNDSSSRKRVTSSPTRFIGPYFSDTALSPFQAVESITSIRAGASDAKGWITGQGIAVMHGSAKVEADPIMPAWPTCRGYLQMPHRIKCQTVSPVLKVTRSG